MNKRLNHTIVEAVENQIREEDPSFVREAYEILQWSGYSEKQAKEKIAAVLVTEMYDILKEGKPYQEERYRNNIEDMLAQEQIVEENLCEEETGIWKGLGAKLEQGYRVFEEDGDIDVIMEFWMEAWKQVRRNIRKAYKKPEVWEVDEATDYRYAIEEWITDVCAAFFQARKYEELIQYCQEVIDCFAWKEAAPNEFKALIGEGYYNMGRLEESDRWFEKWMKEEPGNLECVESCFLYYKERGMIETAEELLEKNLSKEGEINIDNQFLFMRAASFYKTKGEEEKWLYYDKKVKEFTEEFMKDPMVYGEHQDLDFDLNFFNEEFCERERTVVKDKKIYPNAPCPCGSGKKYKKCCGR